ncbi:hypothetical protein B0H14DRAFT_3421196 [Mycena olivaceomarginata]|nr:hypothetical protein B0H14DRAFT_3421196 [Mycena olivaceomarginata]
MGQRHQVFLVARVVPSAGGEARYRCVAAYHHQWCYGRLPLIAARRFLTLLKQKDNAKLVSEEVRALQGKYGTGTSEPRLPDVPCPYTTFLMASSWCVDLGKPIYGSGVSFKNSVMEAHMGSTEGDNNDGITVFDITDSANPSYCFVSTFGLEAAVGVETRVPLSAEQYCRAYYPVPTDNKLKKEGAKEMEQDVQEKIDALRDERLMTLDVLAEAWPKEYRYSAPTNPAEDTESSNLASNPIPSLVELSLKPAVEQAVQTGETEGLEDLVWHPGKADLIKSILRDQKPFPDSGVPLLTKVIQQQSDKSSLDLSGFSLTDSQLISLFSFPGVEKVEVLDLSHNPNITTDALRQLLPATSKLRHLILLNTSITDEKLYELLIQEPKLFRSVEQLTHPAFLSWQDPARYPNGFAYVGFHGGQSACSASLPVFTPALVSYGFFGSSLVPQAAFAGAVRSADQPWSARHVHCFPALTDTPFDGQGWLFAATWASMYSNDASRYGFVSLEPETASAESEEDL